MWLINTATFRLEMLTSSKNIPPYAILSHTWGNEKDEVSFKELVTGVESSQISENEAFQKIQMTCNLALSEHNLEYAWVDTCCIDKSSSAELSEAINSMFKWYERAAVCFAFLADLGPDSNDISQCRWFSRGWTLQELIAPKHMRFFDQAWRCRGDKHTLEEDISRISGISREVLSCRQNLSTIPIAVRMSWASNRETTREEDMAYCLLGIFDINMPMLYGEGEKAFIRLQEEIIKESADMSIFAWKVFDSQSTAEYTGLLAHSPMAFREAGALSILENMEGHDIDSSISNRGINLTAPTVSMNNTGLVFLPLLHRDQPKLHYIGEPSFSNMFLGSRSVGVYLRRVGRDLYVRAFPRVLRTLSEALIHETRSIRVVKTLLVEQAAAIDRRIVHIRICGTQRIYLWASDGGPAGCWDSSAGKVYAGHTGSFLGYIKFRSQGFILVSFFLICRFDVSRKGEPWRFALIDNDENEARPSDVQLSYYHFDSDLFLANQTGLSLRLHQRVHGKFHRLSISISSLSTNVDTFPESQLLEVRLEEE